MNTTGGTRAVGREVRNERHCALFASVLRDVRRHLRLPETAAGLHKVDMRSPRESGEVLQLAANRDNFAENIRH